MSAAGSGALRTGPVGVGVIGAGVISGQYLEHLARFPDLAVRFVADLDVPRAAAQATAFGIPASGTVEELLAQDDIEIVVNLTIPAVHVEVGRRILDAGKHIWSEKPFALERAEGEELLALAEERGLRAACAPDTILGAGIQTAQRTVAGGAIGTPLSALAMFQVRGPESWHPAPEFLFQHGGGPLLDMGPYYLSTLVMLFGPVARVTGVASTARATRVIGSGPRAGTEFEVTVPTHHGALIEFESGGSAQLVLSFESSLARTGFVEVNGTEGTLVLPDPNRFEGDSILWTPEEEESVVVPARGAAFGRGSGVLELARAIRAGRPERASGAFALHVLDVMLSIAESAEQHRPVDVVTSCAAPEPLPEDWDPTAVTL